MSKRVVGANRQKWLTPAHRAQSRAAQQRGWQQAQGFVLLYRSYKGPAALANWLRPPDHYAAKAAAIERLPRRSVIDGTVGRRT